MWFIELAELVAFKRVADSKSHFLQRECKKMIVLGGSNKCGILFSVKALHTQSSILQLLETAMRDVVY